MAAENVPNNDNVTLGNGNIPTTADPSTTKTAEPSKSEYLITTIVLTIYDVIVFLGISIGIIFQVSILQRKAMTISFIVNK